MEKKPEGENVEIIIKENNFHTNWLIESRQDFTVLEKRMIYCIINQMEKYINIQADLFKNLYFPIPVSTFGKDCNYSSLTDAMHKIISRKIFGADKGKKYALAMVPIPWAELKNGVLTLMLQANAVPYFIALRKSGYTSYKLEMALSLTSVYSQRMFELLNERKNHKKFIMTIEELKIWMGVDKEKSYNGTNATGNIKLKILNPAMKELDEKSNISFDYRLLKEGRKVAAVEIQPKTKADEGREIVKEIKGELKAAPIAQIIIEVRGILSKCNFSKDQESQIIRDKRLTDLLIETYYKIEKGALKRPTNLTAYLARVLMSAGLIAYKK